MKKSTLISLLSMLFIFPLLAQEEKNNSSYFLITTHEFKVPEGGSLQEFDSLVNILQTHVCNKDDRIKSQRVLQHFMGQNSNDLIVIREYSNTGDMVDETPSGLFKNM